MFLGYLSTSKHVATSAMDTFRAIKPWLRMVWASATPSFLKATPLEDYAMTCKWLITIWLVSPLSKVVLPLLNGLYKRGVILTTYESWNDPPSRGCSVFFCVSCWSLDSALALFLRSYAYGSKLLLEIKKWTWHISLWLKYGTKSVPTYSN